jgi:tetratricopeptide (TPR) repeat protein
MNNYFSPLIPLFFLFISACSTPVKKPLSIPVKHQPPLAKEQARPSQPAKKITPKSISRPKQQQPKKILRITPKTNKKIVISSNRAVIALVNKAQKNFQQGKPQNASASMERALRIEPRNAKLWQQLALIRFQQKSYRQAEQLAKKSNHFADNHTYLLIQNWDIIARSCTGYDNIDCATSAYQKIQALQD